MEEICILLAVEEDLATGLVDCLLLPTLWRTTEVLSLIRSAQESCISLHVSGWLRQEKNNWFLNGKKGGACRGYVISVFCLGFEILIKSKRRAFFYENNSPFHGYLFLFALQCISKWMWGNFGQFCSFCLNILSCKRGKLTMKRAFVLELPWRGRYQVNSLKWEQNIINLWWFLRETVYNPFPSWPSVAIWHSPFN